MKNLKELEEKYNVRLEGFPREMMCWDIHADTATKELVIAFYMGEYINRPYTAISESGKILTYQYAKEIEPKSKPERKIEDGIAYGDKICNGDYRLKVIGVCGDAVFLRKISDDYCLTKPSSLYDLILSGFKLESKK